MESLGVLEKEKEICDKVIKYKKEKGEDYDLWEIKKDTIDAKNQSITAAIENGIMDFEGYKKKIRGEYEWESKLLKYVEQDKTLNEEQKKILKQRINDRKKIIEDELKRNPEEEADEEEGKEEEKKNENVINEEPKKNKKEENKKNLNSIIFEVPKEQELEEIKRLNKEITDRANEYRIAIEYFKANELSEQHTAAIKCLRDISIELQKLKEGKWKEVNEYLLPSPVTPEFIYGYSKEERQKRFNKIIGEYKKQKKDIQEELNTKLERGKKLSRAELKKFGAAIKKELDTLKGQKEKLEKLIKILLEKQQNQWIPAPLYYESEEEKKIQKINKDIPENTIRIIFGKTNYIKKKTVYLVVKVVDTEIEKTIFQKAPGDWSEPIDIQFDSKGFKFGFRAKFHVSIFEKKHLVKDKYKGQFEMQAKDLQDHIECEGTYDIDLQSKRKGQKVDVTFKVRTACKNPEYIIEKRPVFQLTRLYPPFNIKRGNNKKSEIKIEVQQEKLTPEDLKINNNINNNTIKKLTENVSTETSDKKDQNAAPPAAIIKTCGQLTEKKGPFKEIIDISEFNDEELKFLKDYL